MKNMNILVKQVEDYVTDLLDKQLPGYMVYHNIEHTREVVNAILHIAHEMELAPDQTDIVVVAGWFHDCGHCFSYNGHEEFSKYVAGVYLLGKDCSNDFLNEVLDCIDATKMPQRPRNLLQSVICDADLFHFARKDYDCYEKRLRTEWAMGLDKHYTDEKWQRINLELLVTHTYFSEYGKKVLQPQKEKNIQILKERFS